MGIFRKKAKQQEKPEDPRIFARKEVIRQITEAIEQLQYRHARQLGKRQKTEEDVKHYSEMVATYGDHHGDNLTHHQNHLMTINQRIAETEAEIRQQQERLITKSDELAALIKQISTETQPGNDVLETAEEPEKEAVQY